MFTDLSVRVRFAPWDECGMKFRWESCLRQGCKVGGLEDRHTGHSSSVGDEALLLIDGVA